MTKIKMIGLVGYDFTAKSIIAQLNRADGDVEIKVNSLGGDVFEAFSIANAMEDYTKGTITLIVDVSAMSAMSYIMTKADAVKVHANSVFMVHNPSNFNFGDYRTFLKGAKNLMALTNIAIDAYASFSSKSKEEIASLMDETTYYYGQEIVDEGFAHEVLDAKVDPAMTSSKAIAAQMVNFESVAVKMKEPLHTLDEYASLVSACGGDASCELMANKVLEMQSDDSSPDNNQMEQPLPSTQIKESKKQTGVNMTQDELKKLHPELATQMQAEGQSDLKATIKATMSGLSPEQLSSDGVMDLVMEGESLAMVKAHLYDLSEASKKDAKATMLEEGNELAADLGDVDTTPPETEVQKTDVQMRSEAAAKRRQAKRGN